MVIKISAHFPTVITKGYTKKKLFPVYLLVIMTVIGLSLYWAPKAGAFSLEDLLAPVKNLFNPNELEVDSKIELAPGGDVNANGQIDAGDIVRFSFTISNPTNQKYAYSSLKTNIDRNSINFIHNVSGATGINEKESTITFSNLRLQSGQQKTVSFDARINYYQDIDKVISVEPEFLTEDKKPVIKSPRKEIKALRIKPEAIPGSNN